jgi:hypothetical protein
MGLIGKIAFWRKPGKKETPVEAFEVPRTPHVPEESHERETPPDNKTVQRSCADDLSPLPTVEEQPQAGAAAVAAVSSEPPADDFLEAALVDEVLPSVSLSSPKRTLEHNCSLGRVEVESPADQEADFSVPLESVFAGVSQAFGPMVAGSLQSPRWDKRAQALKVVGTMLRGLDLQGMAPPGSTGMLGKGLRIRDRVCSWRTCCQLLHHVMRDKVMPVRLASHELFHEAFANAEGLVSQEECHRALNVLIQHVIEKLGDSNLRLHESCRKCVYFCAERPGLLGLEKTLARLQERLKACGKGGERQKVFNGVLDTVNLLLNHFPGRRNDRLLDIEDEEEAADDALAPRGSWTQHDIAPFITAGMDDSLGPRVRSTVIILAVTVYQTFGMEAMQPLLDSLRPAKQALLRQKFQESEDMDPEEFARNTNCGTTTSTMATPSESLQRHSDSPDLFVSGNKLKVGGAKPMLPGAMEDPDEETLMDGILEEAGMVFGGQCIVNEGFGHDERCLRPVPGLSSRSMLMDDLDEEHRILEEELLILDMELSEIDEQEALFVERNPNSGGPMRREVPFEVC